MHPARLLRVTSIIEACTWALLIASMLIRTLGDAELGGTLISWAGSLHGTAFLAYGFAVIVAWVHARWPFRVALLGGLAALPPFCTLLFDWYVHRKGHVPPSVRDEGEGADARGLVRWTATHPFTLACSTVAVFAFVLTSSLSA
ncbi:DUF3817 domain-containing protein [Gulosibacter sediminis]|uniref:DUF3817 domain-containing protein n=1 Tax=Gulosibacter sediminis TaxID=1729695 RepID=UPI0024AD1039|nr:DUF3817 domain-containing protein [Gulosibacter sediminis]